nr:hypothetical protein 1 [Gammaproteobacteria bacterium]
MDKKYLVQRRQGWYVQVRVPDSLYGILKTRKITRSLHTRSIEEANVLKWDVVADIKKDLAATKAGRKTKLMDKGVTSQQLSQLEKARDVLSQNFTPSEIQQYREFLVDEALELTRSNRMPPKDAEDYKKAVRVLDGDQVTTVSEALDDHYDEVSKYARKQTINARKKRVEEFMDWVGSDLEVASITKAQAGEYINKVLLKQKNHKIKTTKDIISDIGTFFNWCELRGLIQQNPFYKMANTVRETSRGTKAKKEEKRRPFTEDELVTVLTAIKEKRGTDDPLWALTVIALFTGMRPNEIAETELKDVHDDYLHIPEAKSEAGVRDVPFHPLLKPLIKHLKDNPKDKYLIPSLKRGGDDQKRYHVIGKRFTTILRRETGANITDKRVVFYSLRKNMSTALENGGVPLPTAEQIMGHEKKSMTYGLYSAGVSIDGLVKEVAKVSYGKEVEKLIR